MTLEQWLAACRTFAPLRDDALYEGPGRFRLDVEGVTKVRARPDAGVLLADFAERFDRRALPWAEGVLTLGP